LVEVTFPRQQAAAATHIDLYQHYPPQLAIVVIIPVTPSPPPLNAQCPWASDAFFTIFCQLF